MGKRWIVNCMLIKFIKLYQRMISPFLGNRCRFYPSCSQYAIDALQQKGFWKGIPLIVWRLLRCNPLFKGGIDLVGVPRAEATGQRAK